MKPWYSCHLWSMIVYAVVNHDIIRTNEHTHILWHLRTPDSKQRFCIFLRKWQWITFCAAAKNANVNDSVIWMITWYIFSISMCHSNFKSIDVNKYIFCPCVNFTFSHDIFPFITHFYFQAKQKFILRSLTISIFRDIKSKLLLNFSFLRNPSKDDIY